jgi:WD40 repeat protein
MNTSTQNPYVGPRTFSENERDLFFGREREGRELLSLTISGQLVVFYAQSGAGKSSLVNTCLIPDLKKKSFNVFPVARVGGDAPAGLSVDNIYVFNLLRILAPSETNPETLAGLNLTEFFAQQKSYLDLSVSREADSTSERKILIVDQFEEIFSTHHDQWEKREDFFKQLAHAMEEYPNLQVLLVMREDYIAYLDPYAHLLPEHARMRYYMQQLEFDAALRAVEEPVKKYSREYTPGVAKKLIDDIRLIKVNLPDGKKDEKRPGQFVEPLLLQVICYDLWANLHPEESKITEDDLQQVGELNEFLGNYYSKRMNAVAEAQNVSERRIRKWFSEKLIADDGTRVLIRETAGGMSPNVIGALSDLVRAEQRGGATFYELTHDRLVEPILANNRDWESKNANLLQQGAALWQRQGRSDGLLLRGKELRDAETWAKINSDQLEPIDREYLEICLKSRADARERVRVNQWFRKTLVKVFIAFFIAIISVIVAFFLGNQFYKNTQQDSAQKLAIAANAKVKNEEIDVAVKLAYQALQHDPSSHQAELALRYAMYPAIKVSFSQEKPILDTYLSRNGSEVMTISNDGIIQKWEALSGKPKSTIVLEFPIKEEKLTLAVFSPDGSKLLTSSPKNLTHIWDTVSGEDLVMYNDYAGSANFSQDGARIATSSILYGLISIWDAATGEKICDVPDAELDNKSLSLNPDGSRLVDYEKLEDNKGWDSGVWDTETGKELFSLGVIPPDVTNSIVTFSPDGLMIALFIQTKNASANTINIRDINNENHIDISINKNRGIFLASENSIQSITFSPDGKSIGTAIAGSNTIQVWDVASGASLFTLSGNSGVITRVVFSPDGSLIAASSSEDHTVRIWNIKDQKEIFNFTNIGNPLSSAANIVFSPENSRLLIVWDDGKVEYWNISSIDQDQKQLQDAAFEICRPCELEYDQRIQYDIHDTSMLVYDNSNSIFVIWIGLFYLFIGWMTYRIVFISATALPPKQPAGFALRRFASASFIKGVYVYFFIAGFVFISNAEVFYHLYMDDIRNSVPRSYGVSSLLLYFAALPILMWPGGVYAHLTRFQSGNWPRIKRFLISMFTDLIGIVIPAVVTFILYMVIYKENSLLTEILLQLSVVLLLGLIFTGPLSLFGALLYIFGLQPMAKKWRKQTLEEDDY